MDQLRPRLRIISGSLITLFGLLWIVQGLDLLGLDGGMNGERSWVVIGGITCVAGVLLLLLGLRALPRG